MIWRVASIVSRRCGAGFPYSTSCQVSFRRLTPAPRPSRKRPPDISSMSSARDREDEGAAGERPGDPGRDPDLVGLRREPGRLGHASCGTARASRRSRSPRPRRRAPARRGPRRCRRSLRSEIRSRAAISSRRGQPTAVGHEAVVAEETRAGDRAVRSPANCRICSSSSMPCSKRPASPGSRLVALRRGAPVAAEAGRASPARSPADELADLAGRPANSPLGASCIDLGIALVRI